MGLNLEGTDIGETISHCDDKINYNRSSAESAIRCLKDLQVLEDTPNFGVLTYNKKLKDGKHRYDEPVYDGKIDSTFYTDMATATLVYTMRIFHYSFGDIFSDDVNKYLENYFTEGSHDLTNDSEGEYADFEGDMSLFDANLHVADSLYAYYNEYQLVTGDEEKTINKYTELDGDEPKVVLKKTDDINGVDMDFYYVGATFYDFSTKLLQHDYNANFLEERIPGEVLEATTSKTGVNDIITMTETMYNMSDSNPYWGAYAWVTGHIVVRDDNFTEVICHELGHVFEYSADNQWHNSEEIWGGLSDKYAEDIYLIRKGADISCGYYPEEMKEMVYEFYAEAFQLYFYSPETRAALPKEVRDAIEQELEMYT